MAPLVVSTTIADSVPDVPGVALAEGVVAAPLVPAPAMPGGAVVGGAVDKLLPVRAPHAVMAGTRTTAATTTAARRARRAVLE
jgi:hypothetical protein